MSLQHARMPRLGDKIEEKAEALRLEKEKQDEKKKKVITKKTPKH